MTARERFFSVQPWITLVVRVAAGVIMIWAGIAKMIDIPAAIRAVRAYRLLPEAVVPFTGTVLPFIEIALGVFLVAGLLTRWSAYVYLVMLAAYVAGTVWAWAHGLEIDCGCFGGDGSLAEGTTTDYAAHFIERAEFIALGAWVAVFPRSRLSLDDWLRPAV